MVVAAALLIGISAVAGGAALVLPFKFLWWIYFSDIPDIPGDRDISTEIYSYYMGDSLRYVSILLAIFLWCLQMWFFMLVFEWVLRSLA